MLPPNQNSWEEIKIGASHLDLSPCNLLLLPKQSRLGFRQDFPSLPYGDAVGGHTPCPGESYSLLTGGQAGRAWPPFTTAHPHQRPGCRAEERMGYHLQRWQKSSGKRKGFY